MDTGKLLNDLQLEQAASKTKGVFSSSVVFEFTCGQSIPEAWEFLEKNQWQLYDSWQQKGLSTHLSGPVPGMT